MKRVKYDLQLSDDETDTELDAAAHNGSNTTWYSPSDADGDCDDDDDDNDDYSAAAGSANMLNPTKELRVILHRLNLQKLGIVTTGMKASKHNQKSIDCSKLKKKPGQLKNTSSKNNGKKNVCQTEI